MLVYLLTKILGVEAGLELRVGVWKGTNKVNKEPLLLVQAPGWVPAILLLLKY